MFCNYDTMYYERMQLLFECRERKEGERKKNSDRKRNKEQDIFRVESSNGGLANYKMTTSSSSGSITLFWVDKERYPVQAIPQTDWRSRLVKYLEIRAKGTKKERNQKLTRSKWNPKPQRYKPKIN